MQLVTPVHEHFEEMASWVKNQAQLHEWAGPNARFPCTAETLMDTMYFWLSVNIINGLIIVISGA